MQNELFTRAKHWLKTGADLVPMKSKSKELVSGYGANSKHITTEASAWYWWGKVGVNLGVVCGGAIGLTVIDFDDPELYDAWRMEAEPINTYIEKSGRGYHVFYTSDGLANIKTKALELRTSGIVMVAPSVHPTGRRYEILHDAPLAKLTRDELEPLFPLVSELLNQPKVEPPPRPKQAAPEKSGYGVIAKIRAAKLVSEEARQLTTLVGRGGHYYGRCPFHDDRQPSFWVDDAAGTWGCRSGNCLTNERVKVRTKPSPKNYEYMAHDLINLRAYAAGISVREAIRELADELLPPLPVKPKASR